MGEHRNLQAEQINLSCDANGQQIIEFHGRASKALQGGLKQRKLSPKSIKHYVDDTSERNLYYIYSTYMKAIGNTGNFYRRQLGFSLQPIDVHVNKADGHRSRFQWNVYKSFRQKNLCYSAVSRRHR